VQNSALCAAKVTTTFALFPAAPAIPPPSFAFLLHCLLQVNTKATNKGKRKGKQMARCAVTMHDCTVKKKSLGT